MDALPGVGSWIERRARIAPDQIALVHGKTRRSYAELAERVGRLASSLRELGVGHGDRVGWLGESHPAFLETLFAAAKLGAVFAPVNHRLRADAAAAILDDYAVKIAIVEDVAAAIELSAGVHVVQVRGETSAGSLEALITGARATRADARVDPDDVCIMPHTSGTTGSPKGVMLTHANVTWNAVNMIAVADLRSDDVTLALAPLFRTGGMGVNVLPLLFKGGTVVLPVATTPDDVLDEIERERVTVGFGNPDLLGALTLSPRWTTADLSSVRFIITGGAPVPERLIRTYGDRNVTFLQGYGLSEASPVVSLLDAASAPRKSGSAGRPLMFVDVRTARRDGSTSTPLETGELLVKGPNVMAGYWNRHDATRATIDERGWLHTGDAARIDEEGFLWIIDRVEHALRLPWVRRVPRRRRAAHRRASRGARRRSRRRRRLRSRVRRTAQRKRSERDRHHRALPGATRAVRRALGGRVRRRAAAHLGRQARPARTGRVRAHLTGNDSGWSDERASAARDHRAASSVDGAIEPRSSSMTDVRVQVPRRTDGAARGGRVRLLTDPTFDPPGHYLGRVDAVLLSHDQHPDNLDRLGRELLTAMLTVLSTEAAAERLGGPVHGLANWHRVQLPRADGNALDLIRRPRTTRP